MPDSLKIPEVDILSRLLRKKTGEWNLCAPSDSLLSSWGCEWDCTMPLFVRNKTREKRDLDDHIWARIWAL